MAVAHLIHDRSTLFSEQFREILSSAGVESLRLPARSPNLNAFAERFVRSIKESCLERMILLASRLCERLFKTSLRTTNTLHNAHLAMSLKNR